MPSRSDLLEPIAGPSPGGVNLRYEPVYDQIKAARTAQEAIPEWGQDQRPADWKLVLKLAGDALATKSKDLQLAAWYTEALLNRDGVGGLLEGLELMRGLLDAFWDELWPEIEDGDAEFRAAPLDWVGQYLNLTVRLTPVTAAGHTIDQYQDSRKVPYESEVENDWDKQEKRRQDLEAGRLPPESVDKAFDETPKAWYKQLVADTDASIEAVGALQEVSDAKFGNASPSFSKLRGALDEVRVQAVRLLAIKLERDPDPVDAEPVVPALEAEAVVGDASTAAGMAGSGSQTAVEGGALSPTPKSVEDASARVAAAARYLRSRAPTEPAPYLMLRGFRWGELRARGTDIDPRLLAAPPTEVRTRLKGLMLDGQWAQLLEAAEEVMATPFGRGWLDLQRYVLSACDGLGSEYDFVASAIRSALRALLVDLPQLPELTLMDDSPTANAETRRWFGQQSILDEAPDDPAVTEPRVAASGRGAFDRAMERLRAGQPERAVEILMREASQEKSARAKFLRRSQATRIMVDAGLEGVAMPILEEMVGLIEKHGLEEWEDGETVAQPLGLLYRCLEKLDGDSSTRQGLYLRVCRLDPLQAMQFGSRTAAEQVE
jgi:type VI secretion system protein ImpA